jgi:hypothetical protein
MSSTALHCHPDLVQAGARNVAGPTCRKPGVLSVKTLSSFDRHMLTTGHAK